MEPGEKHWRYPPIRAFVFTAFWVSVAYWALTSDANPFSRVILALIFGLIAGVMNGLYIELIVNKERAKTSATEWKLLAKEVHQGIEEEESRRSLRSKTKLLYRLVPHNQGAVFAAENRARFVAQIHDAFNAARTWGEFSHLLPASEHRKIMKQLFDDDEEPRPSAEDSFSAECVPGFSDGDYPPWLQKEMDRVVPDDILNHFGTLKSAFGNGSYWHIPEDRMEPVANVLRKRGFVVVKAQELSFH